MSSTAASVAGLSTSMTQLPSGAMLARPVVSQRIYEIDDQPNQFISLNVGGTVFQFLRTLLAGREGTRLYETICEGADRKARDNHGNVFIDRDAFCFGVAIRYLRTGVVHISDPSMVPIVMSEFEYYGLDAFTREGVDIEVVSRDDAAQPASAASSTCAQIEQSRPTTTADPECFVKTSPLLRLYTPLLQVDSSAPGGVREVGIRCSQLPSSATLSPSPTLSVCRQTFDLSSVYTTSPT